MNIVITGASKGIGQAIAEIFAKDTDSQHNFGLCSRNINELMLAESTLGKEYPLHKYYSRAVDVIDETSINNFICGYEKEYGTIDVLVNNAGLGLFNPLHEFSEEDFRYVMDVNVRGVFLATQAALPKMREKKQGTIITISSVSGKIGFKGGAAYSGSKFAVRGMMQSLFLEVRDENIRVVTIYPGSVDTPFFDNVTLSSSARPEKWLRAWHVAETVKLAVSLPIGATISELEIRPTNV
ncbi:MAG TPA: SDR family oxidoreductase [Candidatus Kapabacteria bacterium]